LNVLEGFAKENGFTAEQLKNLLNDPKLTQEFADQALEWGRGKNMPTPKGKYKSISPDTHKLLLRRFGIDSVQPIEPSAATSPDAAADLMLQTVRSLEPIKGVPVSTLRLREALPQLSKAEFDQAAVLLRKQGRAFLSEHADPNNISDADRDLLIEDEYTRSAHEMSDKYYKPTPGKKSYYVGVSERPR
jgi:hypothetical protein